MGVLMYAEYGLRKQCATLAELNVDQIRSRLFEFIMELIRLDENWIPTGVDRVDIDGLFRNPNNAGETGESFCLVEICCTCLSSCQ